MSAPVSAIRSWRALTRQQKESLIESLSEDELRLLQWEMRHDDRGRPQGWYAAARPAQIPPPGEWTYWLILAGRGFGKTRTGCEWLKHMVASGYRRGAIVAKDPGEARQVIIEGESGIMEICHPDDRPVYEPSKKQLVWKNGAKHFIYSSEEYEELRGPQHDHALVDELAKFRTQADTWDQLMFGLRLGRYPQVCITTTPKPTPTIKAILKDPRTIVTKGTTYDNLANLSPTYQQIIRKYEGTRLGRQELNAEILDDNPGALWNSYLIEKHRVHVAPTDLLRAVVGVDPSASEEGAEAGIVGVGRGLDQHGYTLVDATLRGRPEAWARAAIAVYHHIKADMIVAEQNNGGQMVEAVIKAIDRTVPVKLVTASRGKITRAEPISALYEQGLIHHVGIFPELEDQMCDYDPLTAKVSPDRMDALVWAYTELFNKMPAKEEDFIFIGSRLSSERMPI